MITEAARKREMQSSEQEEKTLCQSIIKAAGVYERLETNEDWQKVQEHMKDLSRVHSEQIAGYLGLMAGTSFFKRMRLLDVVMVHQIRMEQINEGLNYPKRIMFEAVSARERLAQIREKEKSA